ncbi:MAG: twin-arginine translocation signal domain-containing protein, partial [Anaerolineales bacterium]
MKQLNRRSFLKLSGAGVLSLYVATRNGYKVFAEPISGGTLAPGDVGKFALPLVKPPAMPPSKTLGNKDLYKIAVRQFSQRILSPPHPETTVWSYG